jgi:predicted metal-dependent hydrolase
MAGETDIGVRSIGQVGLRGVCLLVINLIVNGIGVSVKKKKIKNMYLRVIPPEGKVQITAPISVTEDAMRIFVVAHMNWIKKQQKKILHQPQKIQPKYTTGENCYLWGQNYYLEVVCTDKKEEVSICDQKIILSVHQGSTKEQREGIMDKWYRNILKEAIPSVLAKCEHITGVKADEWRIKNMRTRWGTCNVQARRIWLNLQLVKKPPECLEYVVTHELVHLLERSHNGVFWGYMDAFYPGWPVVRDKLNQFGE